MVRSSDLDSLPSFDLVRSKDRDILEPTPGEKIGKINQFKVRLSEEVITGLHCTEVALILPTKRPWVRFLAFRNFFREYFDVAGLIIEIT